MLITSLTINSHCLSGMTTVCSMTRRRLLQSNGVWSGPHHFVAQEWEAQNPRVFHVQLGSCCSAIRFLWAGSLSQSSSVRSPVSSFKSASKCQITIRVTKLVIEPCHLSGSAHMAQGFWCGSRMFCFGFWKSLQSAAVTVTLSGVASLTSQQNIFSNCTLVVDDIWVSEIFFRTTWHESQTTHLNLGHVAWATNMSQKTSHPYSSIPCITSII